MPLKSSRPLYRVQYLCTQHPGVWRDDEPEMETPVLRQAVHRAINIGLSRRTAIRIVDDAESVVLEYKRPIAA